MIKNLSRYSIILCLVSLLQGCEVLSMISKVLPSGGSPGISADLQIGDKTNSLSKNNSSFGDIEVEDDGNLTLHSSVSDSNIAKADNVNITNVPWWIFLLMIIPWFIISPQTIYRRYRNARS
jgi:hypothetical protein